MANAIPSRFLAAISYLGTLCIVSAITSSYIRNNEPSLDMPVDADVFAEPPGYNAPQQVHITQGDKLGKEMVVSWITTLSPDPNYVLYGTDPHSYTNSAKAEIVTYKFHNYVSGFIHHSTLKDLQYNTTYYYRLGKGSASRDFWFTTAPESGPDVPYTFGVIGDLGQTYDSNRTIQHYLGSNGQTLLYVGDLSYADKYPFYDNSRWDTWSRFLEPSTAYQPWIWAIGNHDIEYGPNFGESKSFKAFRHRFRTPYLSSGSSSPFWYSIQRGPAYIIVLSSYSGFVKYSPQYIWLEAEFKKVDRSKTPWLIILMHVPLYNSNSVHYMEGEAMRSNFEKWFVYYKVDLVFSGHVHAYERTHGVSNIEFNLTNGICKPKLDPNAPVYVVIGDGGNVEGLAGPYIEPQPSYSAYRESSFGHGILEIKNRTHAFFYWHRNQDGVAMVSDSSWIENRYWKKDAVANVKETCEGLGKKPSLLIRS